VHPSVAPSPLLAGRKLRGRGGRRGGWRERAWTRGRLQSPKEIDAPHLFYKLVEILFREDRILGSGLPPCPGHGPDLAPSSRTSPRLGIPLPGDV
jgi:hypothetical protein